MWLIHSVIFLASFLLFQLELIISKALLFKFGGTYTVWGAAVVFFQATLLSGYLYSHFVIKKIGIARYKYLHLLLFLATFFFFPGKPLPEILYHYNYPIVLNIFWQLLRIIGPVFFALSTISIIFQSFVADSGSTKQMDPYTLYAASNLGSFAGLLTYPFLFEVFLGLSAQLTIWRLTYFFLFFLQIAALKYIHLDNISKAEKEISPKINCKEKSYWFLLGAAGVVLFLSVTNIITYTISPMPLLWVAPLCAYLISFVLNFKNRPFCPKNIDIIFFLSIPAGLALYFLIPFKIIPNLFVLPCLLVVLFIACMFCQRELNKNKPADVRNLTLFYVMISSGGFTGGILVSWVIPLVSFSMLEYFIGFMIIFAALFIKEKKGAFSAQQIRLLIYLAIIIFLWPYIFKASTMLSLVFIYIIFRCLFSSFDFSSAGIFSFIIILLLSCGMDFLWVGQAKSVLRNYYGIYSIYTNKGVKFFLNGNILHGTQFLDKEKEMQPLTYYHLNSPIGKLFGSGLFEFQHMGFVGLGTGTLAAYGLPGQTIDFFELDPDVYKIVSKNFTYLKKSPSRINYFFGDARFTLKKMPDKKYDLMVIDAFNGDSVPVHLLTCEAIQEYLMHIADNGIILFHISNKYFNLMPLLFSNAQNLNLYCATAGSIQIAGNGVNCPNIWVAITKNAGAYKKISSLNWISPEFKKIRPWTDQYSNLLAVFRYKEFFSLSN